MHRKITDLKAILGQFLRWPWVLVLVVGGSIHLGTALVRLRAIFPAPSLVDFSSFYAAAWSLRLDASLYEWSAQFLELLRLQTGLISIVPDHNSPPVFAWLLQPITFLSFPHASMVWLGILAFVCWCSTRLLARCAGLSDAGGRSMLVFFAIVMSFGPMTLSLTLGQNAPFLLLAALCLGSELADSSSFSYRSAALAFPAAVAAKLFPITWISVLVWLRRWRMLAIFTLAVLGLFGLVAVLEPDANREYWAHVLPSRAVAYAEEVSLDDQSLNAWLHRLVRPSTFIVSAEPFIGSRVVSWSWPWTFPVSATNALGWTLLSGIAVLILRTERRTAGGASEGQLYLAILFTLLLVPHMARYNHVLLLPGMAWLWRHRKKGVTVLCYFMVALSRLNHFWAILLPVPWGPIATGFGLFAVATMIGGILSALQETS